MSDLRISAKENHAQIRVAISELEAELTVMTAQMRRTLRDIDDLQRSLNSIQRAEESGVPATTASPVATTWAE